MELRYLLIMSLIKGLSVRPCRTNVEKITVNVRNRIRLLFGKGSSPAVKGSARAAASETTPRIPDHATIVTNFKLTSGSRSLIFLLRRGI